MRNYIRSFRRRTVVLFFGAIYAVALSMAIFPPFYLAASGQSTLIMGIPFTIFYWLLDFIILLFGLSAFYVVEDIRNELDESMKERRSAKGE